MANDIEIQVTTVYDGAGMERARSQMTADARAAGAEVEQVLGQSGRQAGDEMGEGIEQGLGDLDFGSIGSSISDGLMGLVRAGGPLVAVAGAMAAAFAGDFMEGFGQGMESGRSSALRSIRSGLSLDVIGGLGEEAGELYTQGFGESLSGIKDTAVIIEQNLRGIDDNLDTTQITRYAATFEEAFGITVPEQTRLARRLIANELAPDTVAAYDVMGAAAVRFGDQMDQGLDVLVEFSPIMAAMGIDAASSIALIGTSIENELFTNIDRAGDMWLELRNRVVASDDAREAIQGLGIDFQQLRDDIAQGGQVGEDALAGLIDGLLAIDNDADLATAAVEIFGTQMEEVSDPRYALELFQQALALEEVSGSAEEAAQALADGASEWDKFSRRVQERGADAGETVLGLLNTLIDIGNWSPGDQGVNGMDDLEQKFKTTEMQAGTTTAALDGVVGGIGALAGATHESIAALVEQNLAAGDAADSMSEAERAARNLDDALSEFSSRFTADRIFRSIDEDVRALIASAGDLEAEVYDLGSGFDTTTAAGAKLEAQAENLSSNLDRASAAFLDGEISAFEFNLAQDNVESSLRTVAAALNLTEAATEELIAKYGQVPDEVDTRADLDDSSANSKIGALNRALDGIDGRTTTSSHNHTITRYYRTVGNAFSATYQRGVTVWGAAGGSGAPMGTAQDGGIEGDLTLVNDGSGGFNGLESATLPSGDVVSLPSGTTINTAEDTQRLLTEPGGGRQEVHVHIHAGNVIAGERALMGMIREAFETGDFDQQLSGGGP